MKNGDHKHKGIFMKNSYKLALQLFPLMMCMGVVACQPTSSTDSVNETLDEAKAPINAATDEYSGPVFNIDAPLVTLEDVSNDMESPIAPWSKSTIKSSETDAVYHQEWIKSDSRSLCPILALPKQAVSHLTAHKVRRANFYGGWGVAYDLPDMRSAYGVANAGITDLNGIFNDWPYNVTYQDGSILRYGQEGGDLDANWLAYLVLLDNGCFYNIWSGQNKEHLEQIISDLRIVND